MFRFLFRLLLVVVVLVALLWIFRGSLLGPDQRAERAAAEARAREAGGAIREGAREAGEDLRAAGDRVRDGLADVDFDAARIGEELKRAGRVVRRKAVQVGQGLEEATRDGRTTARIEARYALDPTLKARKIDVDTEDGRVRLSGQVESPEEVARAMRMALEEESVREVTAALQVVPPGSGLTLTKDRLDDLPASSGVPLGAAPTPTPPPRP